MESDRLSSLQVDRRGCEFEIAELDRDARRLGCRGGRDEKQDSECECMTH
jgi:hypothetical protein